MALDRNLVIRTLSGIVMLVVVLGAVLVSPYTMAALFVLLTIGAQWEFYKIARQTGAAPLRVYPTIIGALLVGGGFAVVTGMLSLSWLLCLLPLYGVLFITELYRKSSMPLTNVAWALTGIMYIAVPFALLTVLPCTEAPEGGFVYNPLVVLGVIFTVWANDIGAYLIGRWLGRHRLFERISPKKSWEGFLGGVCSAIAVGILMGYWQDASLLLWAGAGLVIAVSSVFGDLVESMLKRSVGLKDSGSIIPGHGGFLDRFDALLMAVPFVFVYFMLLS